MGGKYFDQFESFLEKAGKFLDLKTKKKKNQKSVVWKVSIILKIFIYMVFLMRRSSSFQNVEGVAQARHTKGRKDTLQSWVLYRL